MPEQPEDDLAKRYRSLDETVRPHREGEEAIRPDCLIAFPYEDHGRVASGSSKEATRRGRVASGSSKEATRRGHESQSAEVEVETEEFTALCPWSGLPDFGTLVVRYVPDRECLELKSLKYYLMSYRSVGILQEHAAGRILRDLAAACRPKSMTVTLDYKVRGGLHTVVTVNHP